MQPPGPQPFTWQPTMRTVVQFGLCTMVGSFCSTLTSIFPSERGFYGVLRIPSFAAVVRPRRTVIPPVAEISTITAPTSAV
jgi:hypothetical protein